MQNERDRLARAFSLALADLAMLFCEPATPVEATPPDGPLCTVKMSFRGPGEYRGMLALAAPTALDDELFAGIIGAEPESAGDLGADALGELLNVVCGQFLSTLGNDDDGWELTPPTSARISANLWRQWLDDASVLMFDVEGQPLLLSMQLEDGR